MGWNLKTKVEPVELSLAFLDSNLNKIKGLHDTPTLWTDNWFTLWISMRHLCNIFRYSDMVFILLVQLFVQFCCWDHLYQEILQWLDEKDRKWHEIISNLILITWHHLSMLFSVALVISRNNKTEVTAMH